MMSKSSWRLTDVGIENFDDAPRRCWGMLAPRFDRIRRKFRRFAVYFPHNRPPIGHFNRVLG
jgi:hypothetical protein